MRAESSRKNSRINVRTTHSAGLLKVGHLPSLGVGGGWIWIFSLPVGARNFSLGRVRGF